MALALRRKGMVPDALPDGELINGIAFALTLTTLAVKTIVSHQCVVSVGDTFHPVAKS